MPVSLLAMASCESTKAVVQSLSRGEGKKKISETYRSTQICKFYAAGTCKRKDCKYAHGVQELRTPPNFWKSRLCESFLKTGTCEKGMNCNFAHGKEEMRLATALKRQTGNSEIIAWQQMAMTCPAISCLPTYVPPCPPSFLPLTAECLHFGELGCKSADPVHREEKTRVAESCIPPPPGLEHLAPRPARTGAKTKQALSLAQLVPQKVEYEPSREATPCHSPLHVQLSLESKETGRASTTASEPSESGWNSFSSSNDEFGSDGLAELE